MDQQNKAQPKHILILAIQNDNNTNNYDQKQNEKKTDFYSYDDKSKQWVARET